MACYYFKYSVALSIPSYVSMIFHHLLNTHVNLSHVADFSPVSTDHVLLAVLTVYKGGDTTLCSATACVFIYLSLFSYEVGRKSLDDLTFREIHLNNIMDR